MSFLSGFTEKVSSLINTPSWWPVGDTSIDTANGLTERERNARRSVRGNKANEYAGNFNSYSGADIVAYIHIPPNEIPGAIGPTTSTEPVVGVLGTLQTISYSTFRDVQPVRSMGRTYVQGYTRGPRTIAGTMIWTTLDQYVLAEALSMSNVALSEQNSILIDQIPPFNVIITFNNEYGDVSTMGIYGIRMVNEGSTFSIDDMITEQTNTYVAGDIDMLHKGPAFKSNKSSLISQMSGSDILAKEARKRMRKNGSTLQ